MFENIPWSVIVVGILYFLQFLKDLKWANDGGVERTYSASVCAVSAIIGFVLFLWLYYDFVLMRSVYAHLIPV